MSCRIYYNYNKANVGKGKKRIERKKSNGKPDFLVLCMERDRERQTQTERVSGIPIYICILSFVAFMIFDKARVLCENNNGDCWATRC